MQFPSDFKWGVASAAYQVEGGAYEDGKGLSIWDTFSHIPGKIFSDNNGDVACDSYHRYEEDLDIMQKLHIENYRFSVSWPRVFPNGDTTINPMGIAYYDKLVDGCLKRGITPWITLYHWDLPEALQKDGGWQNEKTIERFEQYASFIAAHFKGRVTSFIPFNEPQCVVGLGHGLCNHAPGIPLDYKDQFKVWHHLLLAHGKAVQAIRKEIPNAKIGIASTGNLAYLNEEDTKPFRNAKTPEPLISATFVTRPEDAESWLPFNHQWFLDPMCLGHYPEDPYSPWNAFKDSVSKEDLECISQPIDFIGLNIYNGHEIVLEGDTYRYAKKYDGYPRTAMKWPVTPEVLYWGPRLIYERYHLPVAITENGLSCNDKIYLDGKVHDPDRIDFLKRYLYCLGQCIEDHVPVIGYMQWSLLDNFEWYDGYKERFGLVYVDYRNQNRIPKDSAYWYAGVIQNHGFSLK